MGSGLLQGTNGSIGASKLKGQESQQNHPDVATGLILLHSLFKPEESPHRSRFDDTLIRFNLRLKQLHKPAPLCLGH